MRKLFIFLGLFFVSVVSVKADISTLDCNGITLSPNKAIYAPGDVVTITTSSANAGNIGVFWKLAYENMSALTGWNAISGSFDSAAKKFTGAFTVPDVNAEVILVANASAPGNGTTFCSGNPQVSSSLTCQGRGSYINNGVATNCCSGCNRIIYVDKLAGKTSSLDMAQYWNFNSGYYWQFSGTNNTYTPPRAFNSRIEVEQPYSASGHKYLPLRFLKDQAWGYISPQNNGDSASGWTGPVAWRIWSTNFFPDARWSNDFIGNLAAVNYNLAPAPDQLKKLGTIYPSSSGGKTLLYTSANQHFYYAPYLWSPRYLPSDMSWSFKRSDQLPNYFDPASTTEFTNILGNDPYLSNYIDRPHGWEMMYGWETVTGYSSPALRAEMLEYDATNNGTTGFILREDWLLVAGIGPVEIKQKFIDKLGLTRQTCGSYCTNVALTNPDLDMKVSNYYVGDNLNVNSPIWVIPGTIWPLTVSSSYTGYLDINYQVVPDDGSAPYSGSSGSDWINNGQVTIPGTETALVKPGKWTLQFRRQLPSLTTAQKAAIEQPDATFVDNLPWSNSITVYFATPLQELKSQLTNVTGDLNTDGKINAMDEAVAIQKF